MIKRFIASPPRLFTLVLLCLLVMAQGANAQSTNAVCDDNQPSKYYCTSVDYVPSGSGWNVTARNYKGARDSGAQKWQLWYAKDWKWVNSQWQLVTGYGESAWYTNVLFDVWRKSGSSNVIPTHTATVTMRMRFIECVSGQPCYYWCGYILQHDLSNEYAYRTGQTACSPV